MRERDTKVYLSLLNDVRERVEQGTAMPSVASRALEKQTNWGLNDVEIAYALSAPWQAGVTTVRHPLPMYHPGDSFFNVERLDIRDFH